MNKKITIAGLGWLGKPLASTLQLFGYSVKGSVTDADKAKQYTNSGLATYQLVISENGLLGTPDSLLDDTDVLIIMIPPGLRRNTGANYALKMARLLQKIEQMSITKVILVSSTSVYDDSQGVVTEKNAPMPKTNAGKQLFDVEQLFFNSAFFKTSIVRFGGLYGGSRNPVTFLAGRKDLSNGNAPVNLIHRDDCIGILMAIIKQDRFGYIFNAVYPDHPLKRDYYKQQALNLQLDPPEYSKEESQEFKIINSVTIKEILEYEFTVALI